MRLTIKDFRTNWNRLEIGTAMRYSLSLILFLLQMQLLLKETKNNVEIVELGGGFQMPPVKVFMDNTTILSPKESTTHKILSLINEQIIWCWKKFKPQKSRRLSLRIKKVNQRINFKVGGQRIPNVSEEPVKNLGRWFDEFLKDINQAKEFGFFV